MNIRHIPLEKAYNFRDLGGYPTQDGGKTRPGMIFRSDALCYLSDGDRHTLRGLGLRTAFDLRAGFELSHAGEDQLDPSVRVILAPTELGIAPLLRETQGKPPNFRMQDMYIGSFAERATYHAELFRLIATAENQPLVFHCSAGKDRTGILAALLLRVARVPDEVIIADYAVTSRYIGEIDRRQREFSRAFGLDEALIDELMASTPEMMAGFLAHLDASYGSAEAYLQAGGASPAELEQFRRQFVEYPASE